MAAAACQQVKSANPLSPSVAGPISGVTISPPATVEPAAGATVLDKDQPLQLVVQNPSTNGVRTVALRLQIAADAGFATVVYAREGVALAEGPRTSHRLPDKLQHGRTYYWRAQADDGANRSEWSAVSSFAVLTPIVIGTPQPVSPVGNVRVATNTPEFVVTNGVSSGPHGPLFYQFQVADNPAFAPLFTNAEIAEGSGGQTRYTMPGLPAPDRTFYWRVRVFDLQNTGAWSLVETFRSPLAPAPSPGPTPPPSPSPLPGGSCALPVPEQIVACVGAKYPEKLVGGVSLSQRQANMAFIRDRIIEAGLCAGFNFGWNLKRGGPELSIDFLAWRVGGEDLGVDIGFDYDNTDLPLRLQWAIHGPGAFFLAYPPVTCG